MTAEQRRIAKMVLKCVQTMGFCSAQSSAECNICKDIFQLTEPPCHIMRKPGTSIEELFRCMRFMVHTEQEDLP